MEYFNMQSYLSLALDSFLLLFLNLSPFTISILSGRFRPLLSRYQPSGHSLNVSLFLLNDFLGTHRTFLGTLSFRDYSGRVL